MAKSMRKSTLFTAFWTLLCVVLSCVFISVFAPDKKNSVSAETSVWDGDLTALGYGGEDPNLSAADGYVQDDAAKTININSAKALAYFAYKSNLPENNGFNGYTVKLNCDVDLGGHLWIPIGLTSRKKAGQDAVTFRGTFDGGNHTIKGLSSEKFVNGLGYDAENSTVFTAPESGAPVIPVIADGSAPSFKFNYGLIAASGNAVVKNLKVADVDFDLTKITVDGVSFQSDSVGAIIGANAGNLLVTNCVAGSSDGEDKIVNANCVGGLVGRAYAGLIDGEPANGGEVTVEGDKYLTDGKTLGEVRFANCENYIDIIATGDEKRGGILGYAAYESLLEFENCTNYGAINAPAGYSGGMVSYIAPCETKGISNGDGSYTKIENIYRLANCVNYGNVDGKASSTGGLFGRFENILCYNVEYSTYALSVTDCKNYGRIDGHDVATGGLVSYVYLNANVDTSVEFLRCFNYGEVIATVDGSGNKAAGGLIGSLSGNVASYRNIRISGGNAGKVENTNTDSSKSVHQVISGSIGNATVYNMYDRPEHKIVWDVEYLIDAYKVVDYPKKQIGAGTASATLVYGDEDHKVVTDVIIDGAGACRVTIPSSVEKIGHAAFAGKFNITEVVFESDSRLTEIEDWAFGGTSVAAIKLPSTVKKIGAGAFGDCIRLADLSLPEDIESIGQAAFGNCGKIANIYVPNVSVNVGEYTLDEGVLWIAKDKAEYEELTGADGAFAGKGTDVITYPITLKYMHNDITVDSETRLFGHGYKFVYSNGKWDITDSNFFGTIKARAYAGNSWYYVGADNRETWITISNIDNYLTAEYITDGTIEFQAFKQSERPDKVYVPRTDLVYTASRSYEIVNSDPNTGGTVSVADANRLLSDDSVKIPDGAVVKVITYHNGDGKGQGVPKYICAAGTYTLTVTENPNDEELMQTYKFSVTISREKVDLALRENLNWKISRVQSEITSLELLDNRGMLLYLYSTSGGGQYPSLVPLLNATLTQEQRNLGIEEGNYRTKTVRYSVVRNRNGEVEISIANRDEFWVSHSGNKNSSVGAYTAVAELNATDNYEFVRNGEIQDNNARGVTVNISPDGRTATVEKTWYIVDINNWFITSVGGNDDYTVADRAYGSTDKFVMPMLMYGDITTYGGADDPVTLSLYRGESLIGEFKRDEFDKYLNSAMPVGSYTLSMSAKSVIYTDPIDDSIVTECDPVTYAAVFTVAERALPSSVIDAINAALKDKAFSYDWDGHAHWFDDAAKTAVENALGAFETPDRKNTAWEQSKYDELYGDIELTYNLMRLNNDEYYEFGNLAISAVDPDKYYVYYKVSVPNYIDSITDLTDGARTDYCFTITIVREISAPTVVGATYNGQPQKADIASSEFYTVNAYDGFTDAGSHVITLTLVNSEYYRWSGKKLGETDHTVNFEIAKALNEFIESPDIVRWTEGKYDAEENKFIGAAKFGEIGYVITDTDDNVVYDLTQNINDLASLKAGTYILKATVIGNDNYSGLSEAFTIRILAKSGMPWWVTFVIVIGVLLAVALVIFILWKTKVFEILTDKLALAIRTRATVDATIAAVRANKVAEEGRKSVEAAKRKEAAEIRKAKAAEERNKPAEEKAAALEEKAKQAAERAEKMRARAEAMQARAERMREQAHEKTEEAKDTAPDPKTPAAEAAATIESKE